MKTAQELVKKALQKLGVINRRDVVDNADMADGLDALWQLLDAFSSESLMIPFITHVEFPLTSTTRIYTYGDGAQDFDSPRPVQILSAVIRDAGGVEYPLRIVNHQLYAEGNPYKSTTVGRPQQIYWEPSFPISQVFFDSFPIQDETLVLQVLMPFSVLDCPNCDTECDTPVSCATTPIDADDYTITVDDPDDTLSLAQKADIVNDMRTWLELQCQSYCNQEYSYGFGGDVTFTGTGGGSISNITGTEDSVTEIITVTMTNTTDFDVGGSVTGTIGSGTAGTTFECDQFSFDLAVGSPSFQAGDEFVFYIYAAEAVVTPSITPKPVNLCLTEETQFPPGYHNLIIWNLAVFLAPEYDMPQPPPGVFEMATYYKRIIKTKNARPGELLVDNALRRRRSYNVYTGPV